MKIGKKRHLLKNMYYYLYAHIFIIRRIDKKILKSKYFCGRLNGLFSIGWKWIYFSYKGNRRLGKDSNAKYPISPLQTVINPNNIDFDIDDLNNFQSPGCYFQAIAKIVIGKGTYIGPNVGIITANHKIGQLNKHDVSEPVIIGENCWIGMNAIILPGIKLGNDTVIGAGSVVTKSFEGSCVVAGNPAKIIRKMSGTDDK